MNELNKSGRLNQRGKGWGAARVNFIVLQIIFLLFMNLKNRLSRVFTDIYILNSHRFIKWPILSQKVNISSKDSSLRSQQNQDFSIWLWHFGNTFELNENSEVFHLFYPKWSSNLNRDFLLIDFLMSAQIFWVE